MPETWKKALAEKREWMRRVQAGEMSDSTKNKPKNFA